MKIRLGSLIKPIEEQLKEQNLTCNNVNAFQRINDSISCLYLTGYITDTQKDKAYKKLAKEINKNAKSIVISSPNDAFNNAGGIE